MSLLRSWWWWLPHMATINQTNDSTSIIYIPIFIQLHLSSSPFSWLIAITDHSRWPHRSLEHACHMTRLPDFFFLGANNNPVAIVILTIIILTNIDWIEQIVLQSNLLYVSQENTKDRFVMMVLWNLSPSACSWCVTLECIPLVVVWVDLV
jgi:hypothetical protein